MARLAEVSPQPRSDSWRGRADPFNWQRYLLGPVTLLLLILPAGVPVLLIVVNSFNVAPFGQEARYGLDAWIAASQTSRAWNAIANTFILGLGRFAIAMVIALGLAWLVARTDMPGRSFVEFMLWAGYFFPTLPIALGWILLLDPGYGLINKALMNIPGITGPLFNIYSHGGIIWVYLSAISVAAPFILITPAFRSMDTALEDAARTCGASNLRVLTRVTFPVLAPAIVAAGILGLIRSLEAFEVELLIGAPANIYVYGTYIFLLTRQEPPLMSAAMAMSSFFLILLLGLSVFHFRFGGAKKYTTVGGRGFSVAPVRLGRLRYVAFAACLLWILVMTVLPVSVLIMGSFMKIFGFFTVNDPFTLSHWTRVLGDPALGRSFRNTILIGLGSGVIGVLVYSLIAYIIIRTKTIGRRAIDVVAWLPWSIPGVLLGLALLWTFLGNPALRFFYGTVGILILAIIIREMPLGVQLMKASIQQINAELEESARVSGASWFATYRKILLPLVSPTAIAVGLLTFVVSARDISTLVLLARQDSRPMSLLMLEYATGAETERAAAVGIMVSLIVIGLALLTRRFRTELR